MEPNGECLCGEKAAKAYPYPKKTRTRIVTLQECTGTLYYTLVDGRVRYSFFPDGINGAVAYYTEDQLAQLASLLPAERLRQIADSGKCGPTEEVEVE